MLGQSLPKIVTALYIVGERFVEAIQVKNTRQGFVVTKFARVKIYPPQAAKETTEKDSLSEHILDAIKTVTERVGIKENEIVIGLSTEDIIIRFFHMPRIPKEERPSAIRFEAQRYLPFKIEELVSNYLILNEKDVASNMEVIFAAAKKETFNRYVDAARTAGFVTKSIEAAPFALSKLFYLNGQLDALNATTIINVNDTQSLSLCVVRKTIPILTRDVFFAEPIDKNMVNTIDKVCSETRLIQDYIKRQFPKDVIGKILLCGECDFENWLEPVKNELGIMVEIGNPGKMLLGGGDLSWRQSTIVGIALDKLTRPLVELDLLKALGKPSKINFIAAAIFEISVACILLIAFWFAMNKGIVDLKAQIQQVKSKISAISLAGLNQGLAELDSSKDKIQKNIAGIQFLVGSRQSLTLKMQELARSIPAGAWLTKFYYEDPIKSEPDQPSGYIIHRKLIIKGALSAKDADPIKIINQFADTLKQNKIFFDGFNKLEITKIETSKMGPVNVTEFELNCSS